MTEEENDENEPAKSLPTNAFDVIVLGTGLAESLIASSASKIGKKSVLLLDANDHYGNSFGTLTEEAHGGKDDESTFKGWSVPTCLSRTGAVLEARDVVTIDDDECLLSSLRRKFSLDVAFKFSLGDDRLTEEVCNSEAYKYLEFKTLEKSFVAVKSDGKTNGKKGEFEFVLVPASRAEIFENARLSPAEKRGLMRFLKKARDVALEGTGVNYGRGDDANAPIGAPGNGVYIGRGGRR
jgi:RAB protein geranylgeranyltransferase component A